MTVNTASFLPNAHRGPAEQATIAKIDNIWGEPGLSIEDKVMLTMIAALRKFDKQIEEQGKYLSSLQQTNVGSADGAGQTTGVPTSEATGSGAEGNPSIDVESLKLKRLIDKRTQVYDTFRQIIDRYNRTADGVIQSIGQR